MYQKLFFSTLFLSSSLVYSGILKSEKEILNQALDSTLKIELLDGNKQVSRGTGTIISEDGFFVTNYHVIRPFLTMKKLDLSLKISSKSGECFDSIKLYKCQGEKKADLCLLKIEGMNFNHFFRPAIAQPKKGHGALMIGHCKGDYYSESLTLKSECFKYDKFFEGHSTKQTKNFDVTVCSTNINHCPGDSGGPIFNNINGNLIGIVAEETKETVKGASGKEEVIKSWQTMIAFDSVFEFFKKYKNESSSTLNNLKSCGNEDLFPDNEEEKLKWLKQFTK